MIKTKYVFSTLPNTDENLLNTSIFKEHIVQFLTLFICDIIDSLYLSSMNNKVVFPLTSISPRFQMAQMSQILFSF